MTSVGKIARLPEQIRKEAPPHEAVTAGEKSPISRKSCGWVGLELGTRIQGGLSLIKVNQGSRETFLFCREGGFMAENGQFIQIFCKWLVVCGLDWFRVCSVKHGSSYFKVGQDSKETGAIEVSYEPNAKN